MLPLRRVRRGEARFLYASCVVDQHADLARGVDGLADADLGRDIRTDERPADPGGRGPAGLLVEIGDDHAHAFRRKSLRDSGTYPSAPPVTRALVPQGPWRHCPPRH